MDVGPSCERFLAQGMIAGRGLTGVAVVGA